MIFQNIVLLVAGVLLLLTLVFIGVSFYFLRGNKKFPPVLGKCPDYWELTDRAGVPTCVNTHNLGTCGNAMTFDGPKFVGADADCNKAQWARTCDLTWDGITNKPDICSNSS